MVLVEIDELWLWYYDIVELSSVCLDEIHKIYLYNLVEKMCGSQSIIASPVDKNLRVW